MFFLFFITVTIAPMVSHAIGNFNNMSAQELKKLPPYCAPKSTASGNNKALPEVRKWMAVLGVENYYHIHHYCDALDEINKARAMGVGEKINLKQAISNIEYSEMRSTKGFALLPEMALKKGDIYKLKGDMSQALVEWLRSISLKADYLSPYLRVIDYYISVDEFSKAEKYISKARDNNVGAKQLLRREKKIRIKK